MKQQLLMLQALWQARAPRERAFLRALAAFVVCALLAQLLWSAHGARQRLRQQLPQLRQQAEALQRQAGELRQLQAQPASPAALEGAALLSAARGAAQAAGLGDAANQFQLEGPRQLRLRASLPFDRWLELVAALQRDARLRLLQCRVQAGATGAVPATGQVQIDALFVLPEPV